MLDVAMTAMTALSFAVTASGCPNATAVLRFDSKDIAMALGDSHNLSGQNAGGKKSNPHGTHRFPLVLIVSPGLMTL